MHVIGDEGSATTGAEAPGRRARVICNPASGGGSCDPGRLREALARAAAGGFSWKR